MSNRTEAIQHRLNNAGLTRKIGTNQVRAIRIMLTGSHEEMNRIVAEGRLEEWCNDSLESVRKMLGPDNLVSAVLHLDEATPHIHATVVPIVIGERRKAKEEKNEPGKKKYRKKSTDATRLCADDVMTRKNLERFQDTYAEAMKKYGLERGIRGSEARHITTQEFYRNAIAEKGNLQENIEELLKVEELKRETVEQLKEQEQHARARTEQATVEKEQTETELAGKQSELQKVKGELKTQKFKSTAAEAGSTILDGLNSVLGTPKVKRQQQEIESLKAENQSLRQDITGLNQTINRERQENEKKTRELKGRIDKIYLWFPDTPQLLKMGDYCKSVGFPDNMVQELVNMRPVRFSGKLYSNEFSQKFETTNSEARLERDAKNPGLFNLLIDKINIITWFRQKYREFQERIGIKIPEKQEQKRGGIKR